MWLLVILEILALFFQIVTADHKYSLWNTKNLQQPIQIQLSKKQKVFFEYFTSFLKST